MSANFNITNPIPFQRFWIPLLFQTALIFVVPAQAIYTQLTGKTIILQTAPINSYQLLRDYSQTMRYDISSQDNLRDLPGWEQLPKQQLYGNEVTFIKTGTRFYVILAAPTSPNSSGLPPAWKPVALSAEPPSQLSSDRIALKSLAQGGVIEYGLETYSIPENQWEQVDDNLRAAQKTDPNQPQQLPPVVVEIKVDSQGNAVPISLWAKVGEGSEALIRNYRF